MTSSGSERTWTRQSRSPRQLPAPVATGAVNTTVHHALRQSRRLPHTGLPTASRPHVSSPRLLAPTSIPFRERSWSPSAPSVDPVTSTGRNPPGPFHICRFRFPTTGGRDHSQEKTGSPACSRPIRISTPVPLPCHLLQAHRYWCRTLSDPSTADIQTLCKSHPCDAPFETSRTAPKTTQCLASGDRISRRPSSVGSRPRLVLKREAAPLYAVDLDRSASVREAVRAVAITKRNTAIGL